MELHDMSASWIGTCELQRHEHEVVQVVIHMDFTISGEITTDFLQHEP